MSIFNRE